MAKIPLSWLPVAKMSRIIVHWTAGPHTANSVDRQHYHIIINGDGSLVRGDKSIAANVPPLKNYAAHTLNTNSNSIGVSMACMGGKGVQESPFKTGPYPMTQKQWNSMIEVVAQLAKTYNIPVSPNFILSHAEVQPNLGIKQRGKWDFTRLSFDLSVVGHKACGDKMRREVKAVMEGKAIPTVEEVAPKGGDPVSPKVPEGKTEQNTDNWFIRLLKWLFGG